MAPLLSLSSSLRESIAERLSNFRKDVTIASKDCEKGGIDPRTAGPRKSPSLLFRLWNAVARSSPKPFRRPKEETPPNATNRVEEMPFPDFGFHPLQPYYVPTSKIKERRENLLHEASALRFSAAGDGSALDNQVAHKTATPDMVAGRRREGDYFKECGKNVNPRIGLGEINIDEFPTFREDNNHHHLLHGVGVPPLKPWERRVRAVSWTDSIKEYAGGLGHVCHSGERPISDCFRSLTTKDFGDGNVDPGTDPNTEDSARGIPTLRLLCSQTGFGERPQFEQGREDLMNDWETATLLMEEFSSADRSVRRLKRKKIALGIRDRNIFKRKSAPEEPLGEHQMWKEETGAEGDAVCSSGEDDSRDSGELDSDTNNQY
ncbi:unnamed protein product [Tuber aestivum]|uniref:Uncharacterized protein n=1 Tax=Tuber aestivum TaxID=59557 RepID=A0A292PY27_9PEZI|nr:unnamed protein product [Tuber aestivum]